MKKPYKTFIL